MLNRRLIIVLVGVITAMSSFIVTASGRTSAVGFSPSSLTGLRFWIDSSDATTITSSGGSVSQVTDKSSSGLDLSQTNSSRRPTIGTTTLNGLNVFTFDGDDSLASPLLTQSLPVTMFAVVRNTESSWTNRQIIGNTNNLSPVFYKSGNVWRLYAGSELVSSTQVDANWHYLGGVVDSGNSILRLDGTPIANGHTGSQPWNNRPIWIGDSEEFGGGGYGWIGDIAEVLIYSRVLTSSEITQVESYLNTKWFTAPAPTIPPTVAPTIAPTIAPTTPPTTAPTTAPNPTSTTAAPALEIVVNAPPSGISPTTAPVGQSQIPTLSQSAIASAGKTSATSSIPPTSVPPSTTSTTSPSVDNNTPPKPPAPPLANSGSASVKVGNITTEAVVERADNQLVVTAGNLRAVIGGLDANGSPTSLDESGNVRLKPGSTVRIKSSGFLPESTVEVWLFSSPILLGSKKVETDGTLTATFTIPENTPDGSHRLVVVTRTSDNKPATLSVGIDIGEWKKETTLTVWLIVLPIIAAVTGALVLPATRRRRRQRAIA